ncbi:hypothetical protein [Microbacterium sp. H1-D42]|uniref:hypothetical protein n=1 Tax=Microbacterium sp. H1-D42 TaxID=2925844 RepID=UPI001F52F6A7|nr:hypothetical protein [Microbacterium sp. H1-D42]UNK70981.1 hypothetical protein MNR00_00630 [Microbacterium sp. H1-D42]
MSDDLNITSGGAISVDSSMVREIGRRLGQVSAHLEDASHLVRRAGATCAQVPALAATVGTGAMVACAQRLASMADETRSDVHGVEVMADTFELVELRNEQAALSVHRPSEAMALQGRIDALLAGDADLEKRADMLIAGWEERRFDGTKDQPLDGVFDVLLGPWGAGTVGAGLMVMARAAAHGRGLLPFDTVLKGTPPPVRVAPVAKGVTTPVSGVKDSLSRIPAGKEGQVVVEKYTMGDGSRRFVAYVDGTRAIVPGTEDPWDMGSNWDMYIDRDQAASQVAIEKALEAAGANPGDRVGFVGYSQGAAAASFTAMEGTYDVDVVITAGNPVEPSLAADQTLVELRHQGDPISNLSGGGSVGGTGSTGSFTARAEVDSVSPLGPHRLEEYLDTAGQVDSSGDPRVTDLQESFFAELGQAAKVETTEFLAERP